MNWLQYIYPLDVLMRVVVGHLNSVSSYVIRNEATKYRISFLRIIYFGKFKHDTKSTVSLSRHWQNNTFQFYKCFTLRSLSMWPIVSLNGKFQT